MEKVLGFEELLWWLPLARRMASWGLAMAWIWGRIAFFAGHVALAAVGILIWTVGAVDNPETNTGGVGIILVPLLAYFVSTLLAVAGAFVGGIAGYYAPMTEPEFPYRSAFFKQMGRRTFLAWAYLSTVSIPIFVCAWRTIHFPLPALILLALLAALLLISTWYAVNVALRSAERISVD